MMLAELIERLKELEDVLDMSGVDPSLVPVRIASQPSWPFENDIQRVVNPEDWMYGEDDAEPVVYLSEGKQVGYLPGDAKDACW
jgi:hypothetical protein